MLHNAVLSSVARTPTAKPRVRPAGSTAAAEESFAEGEVAAVGGPQSARCGTLLAHRRKAARRPIGELRARPATSAGQRGAAKTRGAASAADPPADIAAGAGAGGTAVSIG